MAYRFIGQVAGFFRHPCILNFWPHRKTLLADGVTNPAPTTRIARHLLLTSLIATAPTALPAEKGQQAHIRAVEAGLLPAVVVAGRPTSGRQLLARMQKYRVPGLSIAVINRHALEWRRAYGVTEAQGDMGVTTDTLFQAASLSKPVTAVGALTLVEQEKLDLDEDVNRTLVSWRVPQNTFSRETPVTVRRLLSHMAGFNMSGFPGYPAGDPTPTLLQVLDGLPPANSAPLRVRAPPGSTWSYSGGGYVVIQQLLEDITREPFASYMRKQVLAPLGMTHSTFAQPLPEGLEDGAARGHEKSGRLIGGGWYTYPESAAAGLWTTPGDLARLVLDVQNGLAGRETGSLSPVMATAMVTDQGAGWGLGLALGGAGDDRWFSHTGLNRGYTCHLFAYTKRGQGAVVMTNSENGEELALEILRGIAAVYDWPDLQPMRVTPVNIDTAVYERYLGVYQPVDFFGPAIRITRQGERLYGEIFGERMELLPQSAADYLSMDGAIEVSFLPGDNGAAVAIELDFPNTNEEGLRAERLSNAEH